MRQDPRMRKPYTRLRRTCAAGITTIVAEVRIASINRAMHKEQVRRNLISACFVNIPILVKPDGTGRIPLIYQSKRKV